MGSCISSSRDIMSPSAESSDVVHTVSIGKNQPLKSEKPRWKSDIPLTEGQLMSKRDEFWDTAPVFDGRKEIWDALKAGSSALETGDHALAQAIIDGANISLPHGSLLDCYDELGCRYQLPVYVLSAPTNLVEEISDKQNAQLESDMESEMKGVDTSVKFRLSTGKDFRMTVKSTDTVGKVKLLIQKQEGIDSSHQRWFYSGKLLPDKQKIEDAKINRSHIVQVIVS